MFQINKEKNKHIYFDSEGNPKEENNNEQNNNKQSDNTNEPTNNNNEPTNNTNEPTNNNDQQKTSSSTISSEWLTKELDKNPEQNPYKQFQLDLGDVITIIDPANQTIDEQTFIIDYIDTTKLSLINIDTFKTIVLTINEDKTIENGTIEKIIL